MTEYLIITFVTMQETPRKIIFGKTETLVPVFKTLHCNFEIIPHYLCKFSLKVQSGIRNT